VAATATALGFQASDFVRDACFSSFDIHAGKFETALLLVSPPKTGARFP